MKQVNIDNYTDKDMKALLESLEVGEIVVLTTENFFDLGEETLYKFLPNLIRKRSALLPVGKDYEFMEEVALPSDTTYELALEVLKKKNEYEVTFNFKGYARYGYDMQEDYYEQTLYFNLEEMLDFKFLQILNK